jgi:hypothetical protein
MRTSTRPSAACARPPVAQRQGRQVQRLQRLHQAEAGHRVDAQHMARHAHAVVAGEGDLLGLHDQVAHGQHQAAGVDHRGVADAVHAQAGGGEGVLGDARLQGHD